MLKILLWLLLTGSRLMKSQPLLGSESRDEAFSYLSQFGYIEQDAENQDLITDKVITNAIKDFQIFAGLEATGEVDEQTLELMHTPRCGVKDILTIANENKKRRRKKRYALQGSKLQTKTLFWRVSQYPSTNAFTKQEIRNLMRDAFQIWADHSDLKFFEQRNRKGKVHFDIKFARKDHSDPFAFDGRGGTLAHAFFPQYGSDVHFDDDEFWTHNSFKGTQLLQTAAHEIGHAIGLSHSDNKISMMTPFHRGYIPDLKLERDDILAVQILYGKKGSDGPTIRPTPRPVEFPDTGISSNNFGLCDQGDIDDLFQTKDGNYYVMKGPNYWKLNEDSVADGYPRKISDDWIGLPNDIDAAVTIKKDGLTYFFKGDSYWKFENQWAVSGYPKKITDGWDGIPNDVDAAFVWAGNGKLYFFKGGDYYKFDPERNKQEKKGYPRKISEWWDVPSNIDAALQWKRKTYFFKDGQYWRFNDRLYKVDKAKPPFPRETGSWWFGCPKGSKQASE